MIIHICIFSKCVQQFIFGEKVLEMARRRLRSFSNVREKEATICFYLPPFIFWNTQTSLYEAEGCVFLFFFNIPQYSVIFYNIQQYFILAKNSNARLREISISIIYSHSQYRETFVWSIKEDIICFVCSESN